MWVTSLSTCLARTPPEYSTKSASECHGCACLTTVSATALQVSHPTKNPRRKLAHAGPDVGPYWLCSGPSILKQNRWESAISVRDDTARPTVWGHFRDVRCVETDSSLSKSKARAKSRTIVDARAVSIRYPVTSAVGLFGWAQASLYNDLMECPPCLDTCFCETARSPCPSRPTAFVQNTSI